MELSLERQNEGRSTRREATGCRWGQGQAASHVPDPALCLHTHTHACSQTKRPSFPGAGSQTSALPHPAHSHALSMKSPAKRLEKGRLMGRATAEVPA